jgi:hypothetical protein
LPSIPLRSNWHEFRELHRILVNDHSRGLTGVDVARLATDAPQRPKTGTSKNPLPLSTA